RCS
ncbi:hypothetical protein BN1708_020055, partial [Verticillium longisporum]